LAPILQAVQKSSPAIRRLGDWLNPENIPQVTISGPSFVERILASAPKYLALLIIVHVLAFFFLLYGSRLQKRFVEMIPGLPEKQNVVEIASEIEQTASRFFSSVTLINASVGLSVWILVGLLGLPHPLLWGVAAFLLHYIPFVGATGGIVAMAVVSLIHFDSFWYAVLPPLAYVFCAMIEGNLATPIFLGRWLTLNPIAIILTFLLWSYLWGLVGTLLAGVCFPASFRGGARSITTSEPRRTLVSGLVSSAQCTSKLDGKPAGPPVPQFGDLQLETEFHLKALGLSLADLEQRMAAFDEAVRGFEAERRTAADLLEIAFHAPESGEALETGHAPFWVTHSPSCSTRSRPASSTGFFPLRCAKFDCGNGWSTKSTPFCCGTWKTCVGRRDRTLKTRFGVSAQIWMKA
jgi:hypothetical protein